MNIRVNNINKFMGGNAGLLITPFTVITLIKGGGINVSAISSLTTKRELEKQHRNKLKNR